MSSAKILIVDDEQDALKLLSLELTTEGYTVLTASTGKDAIVQTQRFLPDLIIMDVLLPDMTGADAIKTLRKDPVLRQVPVIFLTALFTKKEQSQKETLHVDTQNYLAIAKPFTAKEILGAVRAALGQVLPKRV